MDKDRSIIIPNERIISRIFLIRGRKVMFDRDLAELYGVKTRRLNEQVKRNIKRFPDDFMFKLTLDEFDILKSQFATSSWGGRRYLPLVFTEQGVAMLSSVLKSDRAIQVNIAIMRTFTKLREILLTNKELRQKIEKMERKYDKYDTQLKTVFGLIQRLLEDKKSKRKKEIGFKMN